MNGDSGSILFVDDEQGILDSFRRILHHMRPDWETAFATSASAAIAMIAEQTFDVVVLDVNMPGKSGLDLLEEWRHREERPQFEIIMLTGMKDDELKRRSLELGATDLLNKPVARDDLIARLQNVLEMKSYRDSLHQRTEELEIEVERRKKVEKQLKETMLDLEQLLQQVQALSLRDPLTKLSNRRLFDDKLREYWDLSTRLKQPLSCIMADLDHFKDVNDNHSHQAGDSVLEEVANLLSSVVRSTDIIARYGGEEFVVLLPNTSLQAALKVAEKLRSGVAANKFSWRGVLLPITMSLGVAENDANGIDNYGQLVEAADAALYQAKEEGRNRLCSR